MGVVNLLDEQGKVTEAMQLCGEVAKAQAQTLGPTHPDTLRSQMNLAHFAATHGTYSNANAEPLSPPIPRRARCSFTTQTTRCHSSAGEFERAHALMARVERLQIEALGANHADVLLTRYNRGAMLAEQGDHSGAERACEEVVAQQTKVLGVDHPHTLRTRQNLVQHQASVAQARADEIGEEPILANTHATQQSRSCVVS
eukprot:SAG11_NODE_228_length_11986_cov_128.901153_4_plen_200_part_00